MTALVVIVAAIGVGLRIVLYRSSIGRLEGDEATWGLMARHAAHGQFTAFFWSQPYGGTQEVLVVALLFLLFGTHLFLMRVVPMALAVASAFVIWRIGKRTIGDLPALTAALLFWIWPPYLLWKLQIWHGFYGSGLLYATLILLLVLRLAEEPSKRDVALLGLVLGLAFWEDVQTVTIIVPSLLWLTCRRPGVWRWLPLAVPGVVIGALPWLLSNLRHNWWSVVHLPNDGVTYAKKLHGFLTSTFPMIIGLRVPFATHWLFTKTGTFAVYLLVLAVFAVCAWRWRHTSSTLFVAVVVAYPFIYSFGGLTSLGEEPRYVVLIVPAVVLLVSKLASTPVRSVTILGVALAMSVAGLTQWIDWRHDTARAAAEDPHFVDIGPPLRALEEAGIDRAYADYWLAYRMTFTARERIIVSEADLGHLEVFGPHRVLPPVPRNWTEHHHPAYDTAVRDAPRHAYLLVRGELGAAHDAKLLLAHGYQERKLGNVLMFVSPPQPG